MVTEVHRVNSLGSELGTGTLSSQLLTWHEGVVAFTYLAGTLIQSDLLNRLKGLAEGP